MADRDRDRVLGVMSSGAHTPNEPAALTPFWASFTSFAVGDEWADTLTVTTVERYDPELEARATEDELDWAADVSDRQLVRVDTNYKPGRPGDHPVDLTRADAAKLAAAVLEALEDTFHGARVGELRADEAAGVLQALEGVEFALSEVRAHALGDLCRRIGLGAIEAQPEGGS